jgi:hypothetical protein
VPSALRGVYTRLSASFSSPGRSFDVLTSRLIHEHLAKPRFSEAMLIVDRPDEDRSKPDALVEIANGKQPGIAGELGRRRRDDESRAEEG